MYNLEFHPFRRHFQWANLEGEAEHFAPGCEILDGERAFTVSLDIPGLTKDAIDIEVKDNHLFVTGERKAPAKDEKSSVLRTERRYGKFTRVFTLPQNLDTERIEATYQDGVLELRLPKEERTQPRKIQISDWATKKAEPVLQS